MHLLRLDATLSGVAERVLESQAASMTSRESSLLIHMTLKWKRCLLLWVGGGGGVSSCEDAVVRCRLYQLMHFRILEMFKPIWGSKDSIQTEWYFVNPLFLGEVRATVTQVFESTKIYNSTEAIQLALRVLCSPYFFIHRKYFIKVAITKPRKVKLIIEKGK